MKRKLIYGLLFTVFIAVASCSKDGGNMPDITYIPQPSVVKDPSLDPSILDTDPLAFRGKVTVGLHFDDSEMPRKFDLVVMKNNDTENVKTIQADITSFPVDAEITGQMLTDLFGETIVSGDQFDIGVDITTKDGGFFKAFPEGGVPYGGGVVALPGASVAARYSAICGFVPDEAVGTYEVTTDQWNDFGVGATTTVTAISDTELSIEYSAVPGFNPIVLTVDPRDNSITVPTQPIGGFGAGWGSVDYGVFSVTSVPGNENVINPCNGTIRLLLTYTVAAGSFGNSVLEIKKTN